MAGWVTVAWPSGSCDVKPQVSSFGLPTRECVQPLVESRAVVTPCVLVNDMICVEFEPQSCL